MRYIKTRSQNGDTIVEVFIAITIIGVLLVGAYLVNRNSVLNIRSSQEHSEALQLLQGQVEAIRADTAQVQSLHLSDGYFCMTPDDPLSPLIQFPGSDSPPTPLTFNIGALSYDFPEKLGDPFHSPCIVNNAGEDVPNPGDELALYHLSFYVDDVTNPAYPTIHLQAIWYAISGGGTDMVQLNYKLGK